MAFWKWLGGKTGDEARARDPSTAEPAGPGFGMPAATVERGRDLPRFHSLGNDHGLAAGGRRERVRDAFSPSRPISEVRLFAGRGEVLTRLIRSIEDLRLNVVVYGERGIGKTSLLHVLHGIAVDARYHVAYHSCGQDERFSDTFRAIAREVPLLYDRRYGPASAESERGGTLADVLPAGDFTVSELCNALSNLTNTRLLILLDEFDRSPPGVFRRNIAELIKNLSDRSVRVQLVIAGVAHNLAELIEHIPSIRRNILGVRVPDMTGDEVQEMIEIGEKVSGLRFDDDAVGQIIALSNGSPYLASLLGQYAGFNALDANAALVRRTDVTAAVGQVAAELRERLSDGSIEKIDRAVAEGRGPALAMLAGLSMRGMGRFDLSEVRRIAPGDQSIVATIDEMRDRHGLIEPVAHDVEQRHRFVEEGVPVYLWTLLAQRHGDAELRAPAE